jgi:PBP4 family serine-type D-alanyl-D-alanine carboxypeptidase
VRELAPFESINGPDLSAALTELLTESDNNTAEVLAKRAGVDLRADRRSSTRADALAAVRQAMRAENLPVGDFIAVDSSGLDRGNRATCRLLIAALEPTAELDLTKMLALAGRTGTLTDRFQGHPLAGKMRAKTGALAGVVGLAGVADETARTPLRFAFLANGSFSEAGGRQLQERLGTVLATYPEAPPAAAIAP